MVSVMESANEKRKIQHLWPGWKAGSLDRWIGWGIKSSTCVRRLDAKAVDTHSIASLSRVAIAMTRGSQFWLSLFFSPFRV